MTAATLDLTDAAHTPFPRLVRVELRKSYDTRAGFWLLATIGALILVAEVIALAVLAHNNEKANFGDFVAVAAFMTSFLLPVLGIMLVTTEWSQRTGMVTFALEPRRSLIIAAKALVGILLTLATVVVAVAVGLVCNLVYWGLEGHVDWTFGWSGFFTFVATQVFAMLGGFALAALLLNTAAAIVVFFVYKWVLPALFAVGSALMAWFESFSPWIDFQSAQNQLYDPPVSGEQWGQLVVSGIVWLVIPLVVGIYRILRAEVK